MCSTDKLQKQSFTDVLRNRCSKNFRKFHRKAPVFESLFNKAADLRACNFTKKRLRYCVIFKNILFYSRNPPMAASEILITYRSSHQRCFVKKGVLRNFAKFTGKHLCQSLFFNKAAGGVCNFIKKEALAQEFSCEFCEISKNNFFTEQVWATAFSPIHLYFLIFYVSLILLLLLLLLFFIKKFVFL